MPTKAKIRTPAQMRAARIQELNQEQGWQAQQQAAFEAAKAERQQETDDFLARRAAYYAARQAALERGEEPALPEIPTTNGYFTASLEAERAEAARVEAERLAAIPLREHIIRALPLAQQDFIDRFERIRGVPFPLEALAMMR